MAGLRAARRFNHFLGIFKDRVAGAPRNRGGRQNLFPARLLDQTQGKIGAIGYQETKTKQHHTREIIQGMAGGLYDIVVVGRIDREFLGSIGLSI